MAKQKQRIPRAGQPSPSTIVDAQTFLSATDGRRTDLKLKVGDVAFWQGAPADSVYFIRAGSIQLTVVSEEGKEGVIALLHSGDFFGESSLTGQPIRMATAVAATEADISRIDKASMLLLLQSKPRLSEQFMAFLLSRTIQVEAELVDHLFNSSEKRLARLLLLLANFSNDAELRPIVPKISQAVLAARVGTTRSRVNHFLNKFRKLGLIEYNGTIKVHTSLLNVIVHD